MKKDNNKNLAFIDAQNLHLGTTKCSPCAQKLDVDLKDMKIGMCSCGSAWTVDLARFRRFLFESYGVKEAYYFLGAVQNDRSELYLDIQKAGFILLFREHSQYAKSKKKGNVDTDIVFEIMRNVADAVDFEKIVLVSGDGDYKKVVDYLIKKQLFKKVLFPNKDFASFLYKAYGSEFYDYLENNKVHIAKKGGE